MQHSVSEIYNTDEIDFLLDDIVCPMKFEIEDFTIAGSRADIVDIGSPIDPLDSPNLDLDTTCSSWDSHLNYRERLENEAQNWGVTLQCDTSKLKTPKGLVRILLVISSACCLAFECSAGTVQVGLFLLPLISRLRLMVFCALFSLLITCLMLFLDVSHIALLFPFNWGKLSAWLYLTIGILFIISSSFIIHAIFYAEEYTWVAKFTKDKLLVSAIVGYFCAIEALVLSMLDFYASFSWRYFRRYSEDDQVGLKEDREMTPLGSYSENERDGGHGMKNNFIKKFKRSTSAHLREYMDDVTLDNQNRAYIPIKRPDQAFNSQARLGSKHKNRYGYHYVGEASNSRHSPSFVLDPNDEFDDDELIIPIKS